MNRVRVESLSPGMLAINGGSSSLKFALFAADRPDERILSGRMDRIGRDGSALTLRRDAGSEPCTNAMAVPDHVAAAERVMELIEAEHAGPVVAVGHRVVHGGTNYADPTPVTPGLLVELRRLGPYDPEHLPAEVAVIEAVQRRWPTVPQVACFDTAFHRDMPRVAQMLPIPRRFETKGVQRYGFHGLSYAYLMEELTRLSNPVTMKGRVILAHLGNGASLAAVRDGKSIDTQHGLHAHGGSGDGHRSGDLDPGLVSFMARSEQMTAAQFDQMVNHESGLLGISEISSDMRDLLDQEKRDERAAEAVALFCYQAKKWIGSFAAALGGFDTLVFSGGIGEKAPAVRERICSGLGFLGIALNEARNAETASVISTDTSRVTVRVIRTDEELMIARSVCVALGFSKAGNE